MQICSVNTHSLDIECPTSCFVVLFCGNIPELVFYWDAEKKARTGVYRLGNLDILLRNLHNPGLNWMKENSMGGLRWAAIPQRILQGMLAGTWRLEGVPFSCSEQPSTEVPEKQVAQQVLDSDLPGMARAALQAPVPVKEVAQPASKIKPPLPALTVLAEDVTSITRGFWGISGE